MLATTYESVTPQAKIRSFGLPGLPAVIDHAARTIAWTVPYGTKLTALAPAFTRSAGATCDRVSGAAYDFTSPVTYTVRSSDALITNVYAVTVTVAPAGKDIRTFGPGAVISGTSIAWAVPFGTNVTSLAPSYTVSPSAVGNPASGTARNFTNPQTYTITGQDGSTKVYTVKVIVGGGLLVKTFDSTYGDAYLDPIANLMAVSPSGTSTQVANLEYGNFVSSFPGLTGYDDFSILWTGWFDVSKDGPGAYTFGTNSDNGSVIYLDLNGDGDFADAGEMIVENLGEHGYVTRTGTVMLNMDSVRIAIGFYEAYGGEAMAAAFKKGSGLAYGALDLINGTSGHFFTAQPAVNPASANLWGFGLPGYPAVIDGTNITWLLPPGTNVAALSPTFATSVGAGAVPPSGTVRNFTSPQTYTVTAQNGTTKTYTVTVRLAVSDGLVVKTFDNTYGASYLDPIANLMAVTPSGTTKQFGNVEVPGGDLVVALPGLTGSDTFSILWEGWFDVSKEGPGTYTFGTDSDDGSVIYLDLNGDGDFADAGELIVDNNYDHPPVIRTGEVTLPMDAVRIAIGFYENAVGQILKTRFKKGSGLAFDALDPINGSTGHFFSAQPPANPSAANLWNFGLPGNPATMTGTNLVLTVPYGTNVTALAPTFTISSGASAVPPAGTVRNFATPQTYTVTSANLLTTKVYTVTVLVTPNWIRDGSGLWSTTTNWGGGSVANGSGVTADFNSVNLTADRTVSLDSPRTIGNLIFGDTAPASAAGWILSNNGNPANILTLAGGTRIITVNALGTGKDATISVQLAGTAGLTKAGAGTLTLANANTYTGGTLIAAGVLRVGGASGNLGPGKVTNNATLAFNNSGDLTISNEISGTGSLRQEGPGTVVLIGANTFTAGTVVNGGTLAVDGNQTQNCLPPNSLVTLNNPGSIFEIRGVNALPTGGDAVNVTANAGSILRILSGGSTGIGSTGESHAHLRNLTLNGGIIDLAYSGEGFAYLGRSFDFNGNLTVGGSTMSTIRFGAGATAANAGIALSGNNTFTVNDVVAGTDLTASAEFEGGGFTKAGAGTMLLSGTNTYTGLTTVSAGTLVLSGNNSAATGGITISGGVAQFNSLASINGTARNVLVNPGGTVAFGPPFGVANLPAALSRIVSSSAGAIAADNYPSANLSFNAAGLTGASLGALGNVTYTGTLTPNGTTYRLGGGGGTLTMTKALSGVGRALLVTGSVILQAANTYTGNTTVTGGTLTLADNAALTFVVTNASSNRLTGTGSATLNGDFAIDTSAVTATTGTWTLVNVASLTETFGATFTVLGTGWSETSDVWTKTDGTKVWTFTESTGILALSVLNRPPVFSGYAVSGTTDRALSIHPAKILARASDPEGDAVRLTRVIGPSAQGGTVTLTATVNYTPPAGFAGTDSFEVELTDARGASIRGTITITVTAVPGTGAAGQNLTDFSLHDGIAEMIFRGIPGRRYTIQRSTDMATWSDLATVVAGADGKIPYTDPAPPPTQGYYRTKAN